MAELDVRVREINAADGGCCALTTVRAAGVAARAPVVMIPGMFTGRRFWLSDKHVGLAAYLADCGHTVHIAQRRGLSDSPPTDARTGLDDHLRHDLPAVQAAVAEQHANPAFWIGHSFGGVMAARAAADHLDAARIAGLVLFASQFEVSKRMLDWPGCLVTRNLARLLGYFPARAAGLGPENEPVAAIMDATRWVAQGRRSPALRESLAAIAMPVLAITGADDKVDPSAGGERFIGHFSSTDTTFLKAGKATGFSVDYDHPGIVVSKPARTEIWPRVADWLDEHTRRDACSRSTHRT